MSGQLFGWLWRGCLPARAVIVDCAEEAPSRPAALSRAMAASWREALAKARTDGVTLFDGAVAAYVGHGMADSDLRLSTRRDGYAAWHYCRSRQAEVAVNFGAEAGCRPVALCCAVLSADGFLTLQERSDRVAEGAGLLHVPGGHLDPLLHRRGGRPDPDLAMRRELEEELALGEGDFTREDEDPCWGGGRLLGLCEALATGKPELLFAYRCRLPAETIRRRAEAGRDRFEFSRLLFVSAAPSDLSAWTLAHRDRLASPSLALLERLIGD